MSRQPNEVVHHVPAGRTLADVPVDLKNPKPTPDGKPKPRNTKLTMRQFLIGHDENSSYLEPFLKKMAIERKKGPWREYHEFYVANMSGDMETCKPKVREYMEKLKKDLCDLYLEVSDM